jgi:2-phospho-L-lactate guanylyltransferase
VIPIKSFTVAKGRLADTLTPQQRAELAQQCAETVVRAAHDLPVFVVCSDNAVAQWATRLGAHVVDCQTPGLDVAVTSGRDAAIASGATHIIVAHADLPLATSLSHVAHEGRVSMVPDRHRDGTNVLAFPANVSFTTAYGPGSFDNHVRIAESLGLTVEVIDDEALSLDLDTADDLGELARRQKGAS